ncbi:hypothetical protein ACFPL7_07025 [Dongia soli]|uniref:Uncharacterized protein n=1 Tax=Dongia soli TaxID=600628 RepID=A0ABU5EAT8_9PROT|nr:hypothetical protein [Dongia soli]MDY0882695.1 hypothetical protein [Dongia soli]
MKTKVSFPPMTPNSLDHIHFAQDGSVRIGRSGKPIEFSFIYQGLCFNAGTRMVEGGAILQVAADIGPDPYTVEGITLRKSVHAVIEATQQLICSRLIVSRQRRIFCIGKASVASPTAPVELLSGAIEIVLEIKPYLDMLAEVLPHWPRATTPTNGYSGLHATSA